MHCTHCDCSHCTAELNWKLHGKLNLFLVHFDWQSCAISARITLYPHSFWCVRQGHMWPYCCRAVGAGVPTVPWNPQILADQLTLSQPEGRFCPTHYCLAPRFSDLPTALLLAPFRYTRHMKCIYEVLWGLHTNFYRYNPGHIHKWRGKFSISMSTSYS